MNRFCAALSTFLLLLAPAAAQNSSPPPKSPDPPANPAKLSSQDRSFLQKAAEAATSQIKLGQLAAEKASIPDIKQYSDQTVKVFQKAQQDLDKIAGDMKWTAPDHMTQDAAGEYDDLWARNGKDFDSRYIDNQISSYQNYVSFFESEADKGTARSLALYAQSLLPTLRGQLDKAKQIGHKTG